MRKLYILFFVVASFTRCYAKRDAGQHSTEAANIAMLDGVFHNNLMGINTTPSSRIEQIFIVLQNNQPSTPSVTDILPTDFFRAQVSTIETFIREELVGPTSLELAIEFEYITKYMAVSTWFACKSLCKKSGTCTSDFNSVNPAIKLQLELLWSDYLNDPDTNKILPTFDNLMDQAGLARAITKTYRKMIAAKKKFLLDVSLVKNSDVDKAVAVLKPSFPNPTAHHEQFIALIDGLVADVRKSLKHVDRQAEDMWDIPEAMIEESANQTAGTCSEELVKVVPAMLTALAEIEKPLPGLGRNKTLAKEKRKTNADVIRDNFAGILEACSTVGDTSTTILVDDKKDTYGTAAQRNNMRLQLTRFETRAKNRKLSAELSTTMSRLKEHLELLQEATPLSPEELITPDSAEGKQFLSEWKTRLNSVGTLFVNRQSALATAKSDLATTKTEQPADSGGQGLKTLQNHFPTILRSLYEATINAETASAGAALPAPEQPASSHQVSAAKYFGFTNAEFDKVDFVTVWSTDNKEVLITDDTSPAIKPANGMGHAVPYKFEPPFEHGLDKVAEWSDRVRPPTAEKTLPQLKMNDILTTVGAMPLDKLESIKTFVETSVTTSESTLCELINAWLTFANTAATRAKGRNELEQLNLGGDASHVLWYETLLQAKSTQDLSKQFEVMEGKVPGDLATQLENFKTKIPSDLTEQLKVLTTAQESHVQDLNALKTRVDTLLPTSKTGDLTSEPPPGHTTINTGGGTSEGDGSDSSDPDTPDDKDSTVAPTSIAIVALSILLCLLR